MEQVESAITASGYPLQIDVGRTLASRFSLDHEWSFQDRDSGEYRALDILASKKLYDLAEHPRLYPVANLMIECKQTKLPLVFFCPESGIPAADLPIIAGLPVSEIHVTTADTKSTSKVRVRRILTDSTHPFLRHNKFCYTFSKVKRTGSKIELCGSDTYQSIVQPLVKSLIHLEKTRVPGRTWVYFTVDIAFAIVIVDGPMIFSQDGSLSFEPWVRVYRHEHSAVKDGPAYGRKFALDFVHRDFLDSYVDDHLLPFCTSIRERARKHHIEIAEGEAVVPTSADIGDVSKLEPTAAKRSARNVIIGTNPCGD